MTSDYQSKLEEYKIDLPFMTFWREAYDEGLEQYTEENCLKAEEIITTLISQLVALGPDAEEKQKVEKFKAAVLALNDLNYEIDGCLIETDEREELCELFREIGEAVGIPRDKYGDGEGLASEWRKW